MSYDLKDSGDRRAFETGAVRDMAEGKGRMDLLPFFSLIEIGRHFEAGSKKYGDENWRKGMPLRVFLDSALRHLFKLGLGMKDERHDLAAAWNLMCLIETKHMIDRGLLPPSLDNLPDWFNKPEEPLDCVDGQPCLLGCKHHGECVPGNMTDDEKRQHQEDILRHGVLPPEEDAALQLKLAADDVMAKAKLVALSVSEGIYHDNLVIDLGENNPPARDDFSDVVLEEADAEDDAAAAALEERRVAEFEEAKKWPMYRGQFLGAGQQRYVADGDNVYEELPSGAWENSTTFSSWTRWMAAVNGGQVNKVGYNERIPDGSLLKVDNVEFNP